MKAQLAHYGSLPDAEILEVCNVEAGYGKLQVLYNVSFVVNRGQIVLIIGPNGSGKTTIFKAIVGTVKVTSGRICFKGHEIQDRHPSENANEGIGLVPQGGRVFPELSVQDNLEIGGYLIESKALVRERIEEAYGIFPRLAERRKQEARTLSGGERQMLSLARALMLKPELLLLDEPSGGLAPGLVNELLGLIQKINSELGVTILMIEQRVRQALSLADRVHLLKLGRIVFHTDKPEELLDVGMLKSLYVA